MASRAARRPALPLARVARPRFRPDIEGVRAVAIVLVVGYHAGVPGFGGGYVGVDIFFVLSGYLITWLLVHEAEETGTINLPRFYARRARRLLPALALVLLVTVALGAMIYAPFEQRDIANTAAATAAYLSNIYFAIAATDYLGAAANTNPLLHTWSLSVEEQFYIVWPLLVMLALGVLRWQRRGSRRRLLGWMALVTALSFAISLYLTGTRQPWAFFSSPTRAWEFAAGAFGVLIPLGAWRAGLPGRWRTSPHDPPGPASAVSAGSLPGWIGLGGILAAAFSFGETTSFPGIAALLPVVSTVLVLRAGAVEGERGIARMLGLRPFQEIGRLSYSWYLWHWPVLIFAAAVYDDLSFPARVALLIASLVLAEISYRLVENPIRHGSWLTSRPRRSLALAASLATLGIALSLTWREASVRWAAAPDQLRFTQIRGEQPVIYSLGCHLPFEGSEVKECSFGPGDAPHTAVLTGDSHAAQWFSMVEPMVGRGGWRLVVMTKSACPMADVPYFNVRIGRAYTECDEWRALVLQRIHELSPDLTIVGSYDGYPFTFDQWRSGTSSVLTSLSRSSRGVIVLRDTPDPGFDVPVCLARAEWWPGLFPRTRCRIEVGGDTPSVAYRAQREGMAGLSNTSMLDLNGYICPGGACRTVEGGMVVFRDMSHITEAFARSLSDEFYGRVARTPNDTSARSAGS